uniref:Uncharacterized protein n=1 Tax=Meloidogyne incognita TaxID=6306 RepID=A0A914NB21_MELIC
FEKFFQVRDQTFKALSGFLEKLQKASDNPELIAEMEAQVKAGGKVGLLSGDKVPHWAGWAIKAISGKFYKSTTTPTPETTTIEQQNVREASSTKIENEKNISKIKKEATQNINKNSAAISDGWGDEDLSENEEEEENQNIKNIGKINKNTRNISNNEEDDWGNSSGGGTCAIDADSWESINDEESTLTSNIKSSLETKYATSKKPSPPIITKGTTTASSTGGKALKLGAVKMTHRQTQQQKDVDLLLFGEEEEYHQQQKIQKHHEQPKKPSITKSSITSSSNNSNYGDEDEFNLNSNFGEGGGGGGNFATTILARQKTFTIHSNTEKWKKNEVEKSKTTKIVDTTDWQSC